MAGHDHRAAGQKGLCRSDAAPENAPVPDRRAFVRIKLFSRGGVNAVGGDQDRAVVVAGRFPGCLVDEARTNAVRRFGPAAEVVAGEDILCAQPLNGGLEQDLLQPAAMDSENRGSTEPAASRRAVAPDRPWRLEEQASPVVIGRGIEVLRDSLISSRTACGSTLMEMHAASTREWIRTLWWGRKSATGSARASVRR